MPNTCFTLGVVCTNLARAEELVEGAKESQLVHEWCADDVILTSVMRLSRDTFWGLMIFHFGFILY